MDRFLNHLNQVVNDEIGKKICWDGKGSGQNFVFCFRLGQARAEISICLSGRAGLGPKF